MEIRNDRWKIMMALKELCVNECVFFSFHSFWGNTKITYKADESFLSTDLTIKIMLLS